MQRMVICKKHAGIDLARYARTVPETLGMVCAIAYSVPTEIECKKYATLCYESGMNLA